MRTPEEVTAEMETLHTLKPKIRRHSAFGDDHWKAIDLQISVLRKGLDAEDVGEWDSDDYSHAMAAIDWREGEIDEKPSEGWEELIIR